METQLSEIQELSKKQNGFILLLLKSTKKLLKSHYKSKIERLNRNKASILECRAAAAGIVENEQP